jgi:hypothetical protein
LIEAWSSAERESRPVLARTAPTKKGVAHPSLSVPWYG